MTFIELSRKVLNPTVGVGIVNCLEARYGEKIIRNYSTNLTLL